MSKKPPKDGPDKLRPDAAETAYRVMLEATGQALKTTPGQAPSNPLAVQRGSKGGKARARSISDANKSDIARRAAAVRWKKKLSEDA